ncbi:MAG: 2Fe-2S iron-sulfur cluster-binding protein [Gammaproteobacteria bacterium]
MSRAGNTGSNSTPESRKGLYINPEKKVEFSFEGQKYQGFEGDTIVSALAANGVWLLARSFKYHRPRGARSLAGLEADPLVQLEYEPNVQADKQTISQGLKVYGQNYSGSLERDRMAIVGLFSRFLPVGFYYKAFFRPRGIWEKLWEPIFRRGAGLGRVNLNSPHGYYDKRYGFYDIVIVGAGPAGISAAIHAGRAGAEVLLVEQEPEIGGSLNYFRFDAENRKAETLRKELLHELQQLPNVEIMTGSVCNGWFADNWLPIIKDNRLYKVRASEVILAAGSMEQPAIFRNNDLPGVMLGSGTQRLLRLYGVRPGKRAVILTANTHGYGVALDLHEAGVDVAAIVDLRSTVPDNEFTVAAANAGIRIEQNSTVSEALATSGNRHIKGVRVAPITGQGTYSDKSFEIECDLLCMSVGYAPAYQLALQSGSRLGHDDDNAMFQITSLPDGVYLAGSIDGAFDLDAVLQTGSSAAWKALGRLGLETGEEPMEPVDSGRQDINHPWPIFPHPKGKEFIDLDEDLHYADIVNGCADGYDDLELLKRYSTVGMGPSQGRHAALATARIVARETKRSMAEIGVTTARPPLGGEKLAVLAGRSFEPERLTPLHHRHKEAGASMMNAGLWWRPAYYGKDSERDRCIREEVLTIRNGVGLIDVSTLGKIRIRGKDAAEFLDRMYTFNYLKQPVGRARYLLMTNEAGTIIDDGVAGRLSENSFYITTTSGGADNVYRNMLWYNTQWRLDIDITNVTAAYAAISIAGPHSRKVLEKLGTDIDLSAQAFPGNEIRAGSLGGIQAYLLRVAFVGELGYEIHVPASQGEAMWDSLMEAGSSHGIRPVGIEAQRNLRLEKGHIIVGQDTDATTYPSECGMDWAVKFKKPFFVGKRSLQICSKHPLNRRLVGFEIRGGSAGMPEESNVVVHDRAVVGHVTSVARSPVLEKIVGLAYARAETEPGNTISIKLTDGTVTKADVVSMHFYDPQNERQEM